MLAGLVLLAVFALYWPTFHSMVEIWERSETFTHGFLIFPISAWLIWGRRHHLARIEPAADWRGLILMILAGMAWLLADAGGVRVVAQYAFIAIVIATVWSVLGLRIVRALFFPLMFLFFTVPVGEFLIPPLMEFTADFTVTALQVTGIPVYREGNYFSIPSGDWSVIEACSGLRYLIASVTLGSLYAYLTYRSWKRRVIFAVLSVVVPLLANGLRAYMIVMIGHLSGMKYAVGVDHLIYGWVFFGVVMLLLFWIGSYWREDEEATSQADAVLQNGSHPASAGLAFNGKKLLPAILLVASVWPAYAFSLNQRSLPELPALAMTPAQDWQAVSPITDWTPHWVGADRQLRASFAKANDKVLIALDYYVSQRQDAELINSQNYMVSQTKYEHWLNVGESQATVEIGGQPRQVRQVLLKSKDVQPRRLLVWQWNVIDGKQVSSDHAAKLVLALARVRLDRDDGASIIVAAPYDVSQSEAAVMLEHFVRENEAAVLHTLAQVSTK